MSNLQRMLMIAGGNADTGGYNLNNLSPVQVTKSVFSEDPDLKGMVFNDIGTKIFTAGFQNSSIFEYNLSTPYDLSTLSVVQVTKVVTLGSPFGITFNNDGTKIYTTGGSSGLIKEYNLSTAYDLSTLSVVQVTESIETEDTQAHGVVFNDIGTKIFITGAQNTNIYEYNLSLPYDLSTLSTIQVTKSIVSQGSSPGGIIFNDVGTKIFTTGAQNSSIFEYNLSTPYDLSTLSAIQVTKSIATEDTDPSGIGFNNDGTKIFMTGSQNASIYEYNL